MPIHHHTCTYTALSAVYTVMYTDRLIELAVYKAMKRTQIKKRPMSDTTLATLEPEANEYRELDGNGLYFRVSMQWRKTRVITG